MTIVSDGPVIQGTCSNLVSGVGSVGISTEALDAVLAQAKDFTQRLVDVYARDVGVGEVGPGGSGRAGEARPEAQGAPRMLLYGRVQSGKTMAMILASALCFDNGFKVVIVLTTDNVALVRQTAERFEALDGPEVYSSIKEGGYEWEGQEEAIRDLVATDGLVLVCAKDSVHLPNVMRFLTQVDASSYPVVVFDDEADAATPDTTLAARSAGKPSAPPYASTIHRLVLENEVDVGLSLAELLPHSVKVQVTATPYLLLLQRRGSNTRPTDTFLLEPGPGYCGGETFFAGVDEAPGAPQPPTIVLVPSDDAITMRRQVPSAFALSLNFFILAACARSLEVGWPPGGYKHLSHTSRLIDDHEVVFQHIRAHLLSLRSGLRGSRAGALVEFSRAYAELRRTVASPPPLAHLLDVVSAALRRRKIVRINSQADRPDFGPRLNFVVGGDILGRGLTIEGLLATYYIREAQTSQMDTVWQHARMFGYRRGDLDYVRIFLPHRLALRFKGIHAAEEDLREVLASGEAFRVAIRTPAATRATRPNALEAGVVRTIRGDRDQIFPRRLCIDVSSASDILADLHTLGVPLSDRDRSERATMVPWRDAQRLAAAVPLADPDGGLWDPDVVASIMQPFDATHPAGCAVYARPLETECPPGGWVRGRLNGTEIAILRGAASGAPALALLHYGPVDAPQGWYPTLVMPSGSPTYVFSSV